MNLMNQKHGQNLMNSLAKLDEVEGMHMQNEHGLQILKEID